MAYVDFSADPIVAAHRVGTRLERLAPEQKGLTALEWSVVALAKRDRISSLAQPGRIAVALGTVFGARGPNPHLADPRLEALRRVAVLSWRRGVTLPAGELKAFLAAGFSIGQYETLVASIAAARPRQGFRA
jgi:hypothetical protein